MTRKTTITVLVLVFDNPDIELGGELQLEDPDLPPVVQESG